MREVVTATKGSVAARNLIPLDECGIPRSSLYKAIAEGRGPDVVKIGRRSYITAEAWEAWVKSLPRLQSRKPKSPAANFLPPSPRRARNPVDVAHAIDKIMRSRGQPIPHT